MKILIVNHWDKYGGASRASYRLHKALINSGISSQMLVQIKSGDEYTIIGPDTRLKKLINILRPALDIFPVLRYKHRVKTQFSPNWIPSAGIVKIINRINPDIVHLQWINFGMIRIEDLKQIKAPIVWSLHDNWAFTGGCHVMWSCEKYKSACGKCPNLGSQHENDLSKNIFKRKLKTYSQLDNLTIIGLSKWMKNCAEQSTLLSKKRIINIPNPIDTSVFKPIDKLISRNLWNLPLNKRLILFGALELNSDINKGFEELSNGLKLLMFKDVEFVVFGSTAPKNPPKFPFKTHYLGQLSDDISLATLYSACELMIVPSRQENLSNSIMESLACGTPVVAFNVGGNSDLIDHLQNGYLVKPFDIGDLKKGIEWVINHNEYETLRSNSRKKVVNNFESSLVAKKYIEVYANVLKSKTTN